MDLLSTAMSLLKNSGFDILETKDSRDSFHFEDETILGTFVSFSTVEELLNNWRGRQNDFLQKNALLIRHSGSKAWNVYTILTTQEECLIGKASDLQAIEENFDGTRKIARAGLLTLTDVTNALLPVLPFQSLVQLREVDIQKEIKSRLDLTEAAQSELFGSAGPRELANRLLGES